jgi:hypothetical protein
MSALWLSHVTFRFGQVRGLLRQASFLFEECVGVMVYTSSFRFRCEISENENGSSRPGKREASRTYVELMF